MQDWLYTFILLDYVLQVVIYFYFYVELFEHTPCGDSWFSYSLIKDVC